MRRSFKYRLYPNKRQQQAIEGMPEHCRVLSHRLLAERRVTNGGKPGYPRFKPFGRCHSFAFAKRICDPQRAAVSVENRRRQDHTPPEGTIKTCAVAAKNGRYYAWEDRDNRDPSR